jgi:CheY-like chemotaxis protein
VNTLIADLSKMLRRLLGENIELLLAPGANVGKVNVDPGQLEQVVMNLAVNARDAMPRGGKLTLETANVVFDDEYVKSHAGSYPGRYVMLALSDTGVGIDKEKQSLVFEPFFTTKEKGKGTGLGLATVYGIVKQSGGYIELYSEPGTGTTFKIYLPETEASGSVNDESVEVNLHTEGSETILLVEDAQPVRLIARKALQSRGYTVLEASGGEEALLLCERFSGPIHLLLTDVVMPGMSGREVADRVLALRPELRVLFMSGYTDDAIVHHGVLDEGVVLIEKPFTPNGLSAKVRELLDEGEGDTRLRKSA